MDALPALELQAVGQGIDELIVGYGAEIAVGGPGRRLCAAGERGKSGAQPDLRSLAWWAGRGDRGLEDPAQRPLRGLCLRPSRERKCQGNVPPIIPNREPEAMGALDATGDGVRLPDVPGHFMLLLSLAWHARCCAIS
jgi:hypothetical protein